MRILKSLIHKFGRWYVQQICKREYESQQFRWINERPVEFRFVLESLSHTIPHTVLDVGTGTTALPQLFRTCGFLVTSIDNIHDYWDEAMFNRHYYVIQDDITRPQITKTFDFISCVSVLEHIRNHKAAIQGMFSLLKEGGHLVLTFPYNENKYIENVYELPGSGYGQNAPYICQVYSRNEVDNWLKENEGKIVEQEYWQMFSGELWTFGEHLSPPCRVDKDETHQLSCILIQKA